MGGFTISQAIFTAVRLGILELLEEKPVAYDELAKRAQVHPLALYRLLAVLTGVGIVRESQPRMFSGTSATSALNEGGAVHHTAIMQGELYFPAWTQLDHVIRTGRSGFEKAFGVPIYQYLAEHPELDKSYAAVMTTFTANAAEAIARAVDLSLAKTVVDVGGGQGALIAAILNSKPHLKGILFDRPAAVAGAPGVLEAQGVADRCEVVGGDFFRAVPAADVYTLKWVLSDWDDVRARQILHNCRRAMNSGGKVLVIDPVAVAGQELFSLSMVVVWNGGGVRTEAEIQALLASAGLAVERVLPTETLFHIVEAKAA